MREPFSYRDDPAVPDFCDDRPLIIFDGKCVLCSAFAWFILRNDRKKYFRLMAAQTGTGAALYRHFGLDPVDFEANVLLEEGCALFGAEASIRIFERLGFPWSLVAIARLLPRSLRDRAYNTLARNRLRWFGTRAACYGPAPDDAHRFVV